MSLQTITFQAALIWSATQSYVIFNYEAPSGSWPGAATPRDVILSGVTDGAENADIMAFNSSYLPHMGSNVGE